MLAPHVLEENYMFLLSAAVAAFAHIFNCDADPFSSG
jgi:hypothetical protein